MYHVRPPNTAIIRSGSSQPASSAERERLRFFILIAHLLPLDSNPFFTPLCRQKTFRTEIDVHIFIAVFQK